LQALAPKKAWSEADVLSAWPSLYDEKALTPKAFLAQFKPLIGAQAPEFEASMTRVSKMSKDTLREKMQKAQQQFTQVTFISALLRCLSCFMKETHLQNIT